jgi:LuxR family maltose regulon positive regulatory protein
MVAPAGSGKSVLLEQWEAQQKQQDMGCLTIHFQSQPRLNKGNALFSLVLETLKNITTLWDATFFNLFKDDSAVLPEEIVEVFVDALNQVDQPIAIIFDDFHLIKASHVHQTIERLIPELPSHITLILSSRSHPQFSVAKLKLQESVLLIDSHDLRLDERSLSELNNTLGGAKLNEQRAWKLLEQTEGWLVGTKLALLAHEKTGDEALDAFCGTQPELLNYFGHEVLNKLRPELRRFVLGTAICHAFNQELCERALGIDYSAAKLEEVTMQELFLTEEPNLPGWYRYHPLLQDFLLKRLEIEEGPEYIGQLHYHVATFFLEKKFLSKAIYHASHSSERSFYFKTLEDACNGWVRQGELELVIENLNELSNEDFLLHPGLLINKLYALLFTRRFNQAEFFLDLFASGQFECERLIAQYCFFDLILSLLRSDTEVLTPERHVADKLASAPIEQQGFIKIIEAYSLMCNGHLREAFKRANEAKQTLRQLQHSFFESYANLVIILCDRYLGRGIEALQLMNEVFRPIRQSEKTPLWANLATGMLVVEYEQDRLDKSLELSVQLTPLLNHSCATEQVATVYLYSSRVFHIKGQLSKANRLLDQLERILSLGEYHRFNSQVAHEKMRQALLNGDLSHCEHIFQQYNLADFLDKGVWTQAGKYEETREKLALATVYYLATKGRFDQANKLLEDIAQILDRHGLVSRALVARSNLAMLAFRQGKNDAAINQLKRLISRYGLVCFSRSVFDEAPGLDRLFQQAINESRIILPSIFTNIFSALLEAGDKFKDLVQPAQLLTDKEFEIFELLASGLSNSEISKQSGIALSTTKWHLKNIYTKLSVKNRSAALALAHKTQAA